MKKYVYTIYGKLLAWIFISLLPLIISAVILLSFIGMILAIAVFAMGGEKVFENVGSGTNYVGTASDGKKVYYNGSFNVDEDGVHRYGDTHYKD